MKFLRSLTLLVVLLTSVFALSACGSSSSDDISSKAGKSDDGVTTVTIKDVAFHPGTITIKAGEKVKWVNEDAVAHNVTATDGADFASDTLNQSDEFEFTSDKPGTISYECTIHNGQTGKIIVTAAK